MTLIKCSCGATIEFYTLYKGIEHKLKCHSCGKINKYKFEIPAIDEVSIIKNGRGIRIQFGNNTHYVDKRDLFSLPSWNDRDDNRKETLEELGRIKKCLG